MPRLKVHGCGSAGVAWDLQCAAGVLLGVGVAMADLIRQAEGACAKRGAALAAAWNLHVAVVDSMVGALTNSSFLAIISSIQIRSDSSIQIHSIQEVSLSIYISL